MNISTIATSVLSIINEQSTSQTTYEQQYIDQLLIIAKSVFDQDASIMIKAYKLETEKLVKELSAGHHKSAHSWAADPVTPNGAASFAKACTLMVAMINDGKIKKSTKSVNAEKARKAKRQADAEKKGKTERSGKVDKERLEWAELDQFNQGMLKIRQQMGTDKGNLFLKVASAALVKALKEESKSA